MLTLQTTLAFFGVALLLGITPGPDNVFVLLQSLAHGRKAGLLVVLGLCTGLVVHTLAVALGLAAVFAASEMAFVLLKFAGAAYLAYLAWQAWRAPVSDQPAGQALSLNGRQLYGRGILMNLTNPKVVLFFLAFLPQFVEPQRHRLEVTRVVLQAFERGIDDKALAQRGVCGSGLAPGAGAALSQRRFRPIRPGGRRACRSGPGRFPAGCSSRTDRTGQSAR